MFSTIGYYISVPFAWLLRQLYTLTGSYGMALILFTLVVKLVLLPFQIKSKKSMIRMNRFQPVINELRAKYANNPTKLNDEMQKLYREEGISPMSGCLWSFLPLPIMIALYSIIRMPLSRFMMLSEEVITEIRTLATSLGYVVSTGMGGKTDFYEEIHLTNFIANHTESFIGQFDGLMEVNYGFLGLDLTAVPTDHLSSVFSGGWASLGLVLIPIISGVLSFFQSKVAMATQPNSNGNDATARTSRMMFWMMPIMSLYIGFTLPAALGVYWIANSVFMIIQDVPMNKYFKAQMEKEDAAKAAEKRLDRMRRQEEARNAQKREEEKKSLREKQKAAQIAKAEQAVKAKSSTTEAGRVGDRPYARGRSFSPDHYGE